MRLVIVKKKLPSWNSAMSSSWKANVELGGRKNFFNDFFIDRF